MRNVNLCAGALSSPKMKQSLKRRRRFFLCCTACTRQNTPSTWVKIHPTTSRTQVLGSKSYPTTSRTQVLGSKSYPTTFRTQVLGSKSYPTTSRTQVLGSNLTQLHVVGYRSDQILASLPEPWTCLKIWPRNRGGVRY